MLCVPTSNAAGRVPVRCIVLRCPRHPQGWPARHPSTGCLPSNAPPAVGNATYILKGVTSECFNSLAPVNGSGSSNSTGGAGGGSTGGSTSGGSTGSGSTSDSGGTPSWVWAIVGSVLGCAALAAVGAGFLWRRKRRAEAARAAADGKLGSAEAGLVASPFAMNGAPPSGSGSGGGSDGHGHSGPRLSADGHQLSGSASSVGALGSGGLPSQLLRTRWAQHGAGWESVPLGFKLPSGGLWLGTDQLGGATGCTCACATLLLLPLACPGLAPLTACSWEISWAVEVGWSCCSLQHSRLPSCCDLQHCRLPTTRLRLRCMAHIARHSLRCTIKHAAATPQLHACSAQLTTAAAGHGVSF